MESILITELVQAGWIVSFLFMLYLLRQLSGRIVNIEKKVEELARNFESKFCQIETKMDEKIDKNDHYIDISGWRAEILSLRADIREVFKLFKEE